MLEIFSNYTCCLIIIFNLGSNIVKPDIAAEIAEEIEKLSINKDSISISEIEKEVFNRLIDKCQLVTARSYEAYRSVREFQREHNSSYCRNGQSQNNIHSKFISSQNKSS